ncbi:MAG: FAD-binding oxidoreductase [Deltaproteobacteria bacterium]|nr:FAD-binding oxidoreductase [Deltaproteobacteria bacterium]
MTKKDALIKIVDAERVADDSATLDDYSRDHSFAPPMKPLLVVRPQNADEVQDIVKWANQTSTPLVPVSSGRPHFRGDSVPSSEGAVIVDLSGMDRIIMMDRRNRVAIVEPGVTFSQLQPELAKEGLRLSMPLLPRASKSVLGSLLEREPIMNPRYAWSLNEPLRCIETVMGNGEMFRTGELAGAGVSTSTREEEKLVPIEELLEKQKKIQGTALYQYGPGQFNFHKLVSAAQGTMGIVTWASLRCEVLPKAQKFFLVPSENLDSLVGFAYKLLRIRFHDELMLLNNSSLASVLGEGTEQIMALRKELPPWTLVLGLTGRDILAQERVEFLEKDITDIAQQLKVSLESVIPGATGEQVAGAVLNPSREPYWKLRSKGGCQDIFFLTTLNRVPEFIATMNESAEAAGYPLSDLGTYIQPTHMGTSCHVEFSLPYDPNDENEVARVQELFTKASEKLSNQGAFYTRPYGIWADMAYGRNAEHTSLSKQLKGIFDPNNVLNPGKLCF